MSQPSLEPYLRARNVDPSLIPSNPPRGIRRPTPAKVQESDFSDFLRRLVTLALSPITIPLRIVSKTLRSPLTVSLVLRLILLGFLVLSSAVFSILAVGAFWYSWGTGGTVEVEGWLTYGSREQPIPHALVPLPTDLIQEDLRYDVQVEMELVRPSRGAEETGNFMLGVDLRSYRNPDITVIRASQPSLPPPALHSSLISLPSFPTYLLPPCILPWPVRSFCPSRLLGYDDRTISTLRNRRRKGGFSSPAKGKDAVLLKKELMEAVLLKPARGGEAVVGAVYVSIGREDAASGEKCSSWKEVRTTGWVVVRFIPRPTGVRWLLSSHPLPPLLLLPPVSLGLTLTSSLFAFLIITYLARSNKPKKARISQNPNPMSEESLLAERTKQTFSARDEAERTEAARRREEWEEVETSALGGMRRMPVDKQRSRIDSAIGGSETTAPTTIRSFGPVPESVTESSVSGTSDGERETSELATGSETATGTGTGTDGTRTATEGSISEWDDQ